MIGVKTIGSPIEISRCWALAERPPVMINPAITEVPM